MPKPRLYVEVIWRDAEDGATWMAEKDAVDFAKQDCLVISRCWLVKKNKQFIVLAEDETISGNHPGELGRICKIPVKMIVSQESLNVVPIQSSVKSPPPLMSPVSPAASSTVPGNHQGEPTNHQSPDKHKD